MSGAGPQLAPSRPRDAAGGRNRLAHLLHALNQPLTGLQCSIELALAAPRSADDYIRILGEGLQLVSRMRDLVEALRELADLQSTDPQERLIVLLDNLVREAGKELQPVAESRNVRLRVEASEPLPVRADVGLLTSLLFRVIGCAISLSAEGSTIGVHAACERGAANFITSWSAGPPPVHSPFSRPELGLLISEAAWEHLGGSCEHSETGEIHRWTLRIPMAWSLSSPELLQNFAQRGDPQ
ncbi:MAG TPA: hypothetical protein VMS18_03765 [Candidatus Binatia bacterium]|nr:hypothetical protein [Candidatus Binatia bacterium]